MGNTWGRIFRVTTFGESHGPAIGAVIDGMPAGIKIDRAAFQRYIDRRRPGRRHASPRREADQIEFLSGLFEDVTLGTPLAVMARNNDMRSRDYEELKDVYRPSHGDYTWQQKYGFRDHRGGGRCSGRETLGRVMAGAAAEQLLQQWADKHQRPRPEIAAWLESLGPINSPSSRQRLPEDLEGLSREQIDSFPLRCPYGDVRQEMEAYLSGLEARGDSCGATVVFAARNIPAGWGEPVFDRLDACIASALMSVPAVKSAEIGEGSALSSLEGSSANDTLGLKDGKAEPLTNRSGGVWGGISNGGILWGRAAFKPSPSIALPQQTLSKDLQPVKLEIRGRHDPCAALRGIPVIEAMLALVLADALLSRGLSSISTI